MLLHIFALRHASYPRRYRAGFTIFKVNMTFALLRTCSDSSTDPIIPSEVFGAG